MHGRLRWMVVVALSVLAVSGLAGSRDQAKDRRPSTEPVITPIVLAVLAPPVAVRGSDHRLHAVYELELRNMTPADAKVERVEIRDLDRDRALLSLPRAEVVERSKRSASDEPQAVLAARQFAILHLHLTFEREADLPRTLVHRVEAWLDAAPPGHERTVSTGGEIGLSRQPVAALGPPLKGNRYIAGDGCCDSTRHVRALLPLNGRLWLSQRYAIDWEQLDAQNRIFAGDQSELASYHVYGDPVLAVADATVAVAVDGLPDVPPGEFPALGVDEADGNHIILDLGDGRYVLYAHLQPGSLRVGSGERVRRGQELARVGNSGNTSEPHLHLHVMDAPSALLANGVPYVFDRYALTGIDRAGTADFDHAAASGEPANITPIDPPTIHSNELPLDLTVVDWLDD